jgi:hypothetical protein
MKISKTTLEILKNFSTINENILINPGNKLQTISGMKNIFAEAEIAENFPVEVAIYDLNAFLSTFSLFEDADIEFNDTHMIFSKGRVKSKYFYANKENLVVPKKSITMPDCEVTFNLSQQTILDTLKASSVMSLPDITISSNDDGVSLSVRDKKNSSSNNYDTSIECDSDGKFEMNFKSEHWKIIADDYEVKLSKLNISQFTAKNRKLKYWIALEDSKYNKG